MELTWTVKRFEELTTEELYRILQIRCAVFIVEQNCPYLDVDDKDRVAFHLCGYKGNKLAAYTRLFCPGDYFSTAAIGRVVVDPAYRRYGVGKQLMTRSIEWIESALGHDTITISAQAHLQKFYESLGFRQIGAPYLEDNIPHIRMERSNKN